jgi:hypothetical protein
LRDIGGDGFGFEGIGAVEQAGARFQTLDHPLLARQAEINDVAAYGAQVAPLDQAWNGIMSGNLDDESAAMRRNNPALQRV